MSKKIKNPHDLAFKRAMTDIRVARGFLKQFLPEKLQATIDMRTLKPLDMKTVAESVKKTGRLVTVSEGFCMCGAGREITGQFIEYKFSDGTCGFDYLEAPPVNLAAADVPPPMSEPLEAASIPSVEQIVEAVKAIV